MTPRKPTSAAFWATVVVVAALVGYCLSSGPAIWLLSAGYLSIGTVETIYSPLTWIQDRSPEPLRRAGYEWISFWALDDWEREVQEEVGRGIAKSVLDKIANDLANKNEDK
jgi:hypothetical protein